jgi:uncharacterized membrane protein YdjX (TVP38/TMEM64 family)
MTDKHTSPPAARAVILALLVVALVVMAASETVHSAVLGVLGAANGIIAGHAVLGPVVFVLLAALSAMLAFFSSALLVAPAVLAWGPVRSMVLLWLGWMLGGIAAYFAARFLGRPLIRSLVSAKGFEHYATKLTRDTPFTAVLLLQLSLPSELPGYLLGVVRYPPLRYLAALAIAEVPYAIATVMIGEGFVERRVTLLLSLGALAIIALVVVARALRSRLA